MNGSVAEERSITDSVAKGAGGVGEDAYDDERIINSAVGAFGFQTRPEFPSAPEQTVPEEITISPPVFPKAVSASLTEEKGDEADPLPPEVEAQST